LTGLLTAESSKAATTDGALTMQLAGRIANTFIQSKLTPLIVLASLLLGVIAVIITPREEEPQILVPMIDVFVQYPGASSREVEERVTTPMEKFLWEIDGVEYIYSMSGTGGSTTIVRFYVGRNMEDSLVKLYNKLMSNYDKIPPGVSQPLVKPRSIDDVPILSLTMWSRNPGYTGYELRQAAGQLANELKKDTDVAEFTVTGGQPRQVTVNLDPVKLRSYNTTALQILAMLKKANVVLGSGEMAQSNQQIAVETGGFLASAKDVGNVVVNVFENRPVYLRDVAQVTDGPAEVSDYVFMGFGPAATGKASGRYEAVTIAIAKKKGTNATHIAERVLDKIEKLKGSLIPSDIEVTTTRNYGETAKEKSNELLYHMLIAAVSVTILVAMALGWRASLVVAVAVPVTLALTILVSYTYGYTLNRVTLFALIFSIGILVDDAIVVVENIHRHFKLSGVSVKTAIEAVDEVGNPTILATFAVIAALLPMAMVRGLMGPYMRPIPVGASAAMLISLLIAFIISPWLAYKALRKHDAEERVESEKGVLARLNHMYEKNLRWLLESHRHRMIGLAIVVLLLLGAVAMLPLTWVTVKMLPFDNKSEMQVVIDMPEGTTLEQTAAVAAEIGSYVEKMPEVTDYQMYIGTSSPFNFNGLVRHYYLRRGANVADIQMEFVPKGRRNAQSHAIAKRIRPAIKEIADKHGARVKVLETPPGPPVLSTLVAEVYGPDYRRQTEIAHQVMGVFEDTPGVVDVDWYVEADQRKIVLDVDKEKAAFNGIDTADVARTVQIALDGGIAGLAHFEFDKEPVNILLRAPIERRSTVEDLGQMMVAGGSGNMVPVSELVHPRQTVIDKTIYHKNLKPVVYVIGEVAGSEESPVYAILKMTGRISDMKLPEGYAMEQYSAVQPALEDKYAMKWDGEWHITYEVFRDLGMAFAVVLVLIYVMVVGWFRSFIVPLVILAPIPLSLVGILPGHALMGAFFTATSMIGFIAGAGIVVRNSIILVDFIELKLAEGMELKEAIVQAGLIRFRPMLLTAAAVVVGSSVILLDPIFQGMAISLMAGEVAATFLSRTTVPVLYYVYRHRLPTGKSGDVKEV
jgi:multidrug efflux pump subunit AcrB